MTSPSPSVGAALERWRGSLIDLSRRNPLLSLRPTKTSYISISLPGAAAVFERIAVGGKPWKFWLPPETEGEETDEPASISLEHIDPRPDELVCGDLSRKALLRVLTNLYRRANTDYQERGLHVLHLAFGVLEWREQDGSEPFRSPLLLLPVELTRQSLREPFRLNGLEEDPILNPALEARLQQDFDFRLPPPPEDWSEKPLAAWLEEVAQAIAGLPGWRVEPQTALTLFSFFKGVMYQDLQENAARAAEHPLIRALAGEAVGDALTPGELPDAHELDDVQAPQKTFHILDADASQRLCLEAAARGHSFVLHGPPGTGKSQTIANLIADCLATGKKVLFVSEKMAALEVVFKRLRAVGLGDYCLEVHSHKANKREVVTELRRCLEERRQASNPADDEEYERLKDRRDRLNRYAAALHEPREPLQRSAWWALSELARRSGAPGFPLPDLNVGELNSSRLDEARQAALRMQQLWHIREQGEAFPWWGYKAPERYNLQLRDEVLGLLDRVRGRLDKLIAAADEYGRKLGVSGPVPWLLRAGELLDASPKPPAAWLTETDLPRLAADLEQCTNQYRDWAAVRAPLTERYGAALWKAGEGTAAGVEQAWRAAAPLLAPGDNQGSGLLTRQQQLRGWAADTQRRAPAWIPDARVLEKWLGVTLPTGAGGSGKDDPSPTALRRLMRLANLCMTETAPEASWVTDAAKLQEARTLIESTRPVFADYHRRRGLLLKTYTEQFFDDLDHDYLVERFAGPYSSWLRFFSLQWRRDRKAIRRRTHAGELPATVRDDVTEARNLLHEKARRESEGPSRKTVLGRYEKGLATDFDAAEKATRVAAEAVEVARDLDCEAPPQKLVEALSGTNPATEKIRAATKRLHDTLGPWLHTTEELSEFLPAANLPGSGAELDDTALSALTSFAKDLQAKLNHFGSLTDPLLSAAKSPPPDAAALVADLRQAEQVLAADATHAVEDQKWAARFGEAFQGSATDWPTLKKALSWVVKAREHLAAAGHSGPAPAEFVRLATAAPKDSAKDVRQAKEQFDQALRGLESHYEGAALPLGGKKADELPLAELRDRLAKMKDRVGELADWIDYRRARERFAHLGLSAFLARVEKDPPPRDQLADALMKSVLQRWLEQVFADEPALRDFRRDEHERTVAEFRDLDKRLIRAAADRVAGLAERQKPAAPAAIPGSETATLMREAHKKARHLPIRRLFEEVPNLLLQLKPCLLMSPLSVSQFLHPEKLQFDLVVFDEASQICPEDAVGAVYRGKQVIVTGDDRQLPPTDFFRQMTDDEDADEEAPAAFESVLDACLGAGLRPHMLRWHYRSRHESLIAYSNSRFYDSKLVTFPAAGEAGPLGVKFHFVEDGVYDRGGRRDNRREAEAVVDLIFEHMRRHGTAKTLGAIAFSEAQMTAIEDELERRLADQPELEPLFAQDRLEGFFVKNLETVQGDERDVILFSVGYGKDEGGRLTMNFGPLNRQGGERRLNVATTRARETLIVVSSIRAADLDMKATQAAGVRHLYQYLDYAERGVAALELDRPQGSAEPESPFEADVIAEVKRLGYEATPQVGCSGYRVDIGVSLPSAPGRFVLGIECDGATYHSAATARDRDRLRQDVLEQLGWRIHRIWSPDWLYRRADELGRLRKALEESAKGAPPPREAPAQIVPTSSVRKVEVAAGGGTSVPGAVPYKPAALKVGKQFAKREMHEASCKDELCRLVAQLAREEGPVHLDVTVQRLRKAWKVGRAGDRIRGAVEAASVLCEQKGKLRRRGDFLWPASDGEVVVRYTDPKNPETAREVEQIAPEELQAGMRLLIRQGGAMAEDALLSQAAKLFGFAKLGDTIRARLEESLEALRQQGECVSRGGAVALAT